MILLLLFCELIIFRHTLFQGSALYGQIIRDPNPILASTPWYQFQTRALEQGTFPLWNPWNGLGVPQLANYQSGFFSPLLAPLFLLPLPAIAVSYLLLRLVLAGWGAYLYARHLRMRHPPAALAGLAFALSGWMIQYVNNQHLVIDLLLPFLFYCLDRLGERRRFRDCLAAAGVLTLILLGGQPDSALFTLALGLAYALFLHLRSLDRFFRLAVPLGLAVLWSLIQTLPFLEYLPHAWTYHLPGFGLQHLPLAGAITLLAPGFFGLTGEERLPVMMMLPYLGAIPLALAVAAALNPRRLPPAVLFFSITALVMAGLLHGLPLFLQFMALPGLNLLSFFKYCQPLLTFAVAILAGWSADRLSPRQKRPAFLLALSLLVIGFALNYQWIPEVRPVRIISCGLAAAGLAAGWLFLARPRALLALAGLGLILDAEFNSPLRRPNLEPRDLSFLAEFRSGGPSYPRLAATEDVFPPNRGVLEQVADVRVTDGIFVARGIRFLNLLNGHSEAEGLLYLTPYNHTRVAPEPERWQGPLGRLARLRWYLSREPLPPNATVDRILKQARAVAPRPEFITRAGFDLQGDFRRTLYQHPPSRIEIPAETFGAFSGLKFGLAFAPSQWALPGDGAWFVALSAGYLLLARSLNPSQNPAERRWVDLEMKFPGRAPVRLSTLPGSSPDHDWAGWGDLRGLEERVSMGRIRGGVRVHEQPLAFPLAFLVSEWQGVESSEESAAWLKTHHDYEKRAVVEGAVSSFGNRAPVSGRVQALKKSEGSLQLMVRANQASLLVISESYFPGWQAFLAGRQVRIFPADLAFQGIFLDAGNSRLELVYRPWAFRVGLDATLVSLLLLLLPVVRRSRRRPSG